jgi:probable O-glycosylation ligase (exosortase A-associated)
LFFAIFLPVTLRTRLRVESLLLVMMLSIAALAITGGIKTLLSGGGYGALVILVNDNSGLYEGSIISCMAVACIPIILWLSRHGTIFPPDWRVKGFAYALSFACLLIPVGTQARTGLLCIGALFLVTLRDTKHRLLYMAGAAMLVLAAVPFLPQSFTDRMGTIQTYQSDQSASTRLAVWGWTLDYVKERPFGGGFEAYLQNRFQFQTVSEQTSGAVERVSTTTLQDQGRAWHSSYFEMLGEQGFPGLFLFLLIHAVGLVRMERLRRRYRKAEGPDAWIAPLATALQNFQLIYLVGAAFVAIAFQPFPWMVLAVQIGFDQWVSRREAAARRKPFAAIAENRRVAAEPARPAAL